MASKQYDAGHFSFLEIIKVLYQTAGPAFAKGALVKTGVSAAKKAPEVEFDSFEAFVESIETLDNPIAQFEGKAVHYGEGVFGLPACPFANSIKTYVGVTGGMPDEYKGVTAEMNKPSGVTDALRVGHGAAVSPFCGVHQPIRSALGERIKVGGRRLQIYQLGCKSGSGARGLAKEWMQSVGVSDETVGKVLDSNMCCYMVRFEGDA
jgi:hypothetical protein